jgi:15-cis-phytoene synthase/lycopene beta-cyclase
MSSSPKPAGHDLDYALGQRQWQPYTRPSYSSPHVLTRTTRSTSQWIISRSAWSYPPNSILFKIFHVPIEEHLFFLLQPLLLVLLQALIGLSRAIPFRWRDKPVVSDIDDNDGVNVSVDQGKDEFEVKVEEESKPKSPGRIRRTKEEKVQTLPRRPLAALSWLFITTLGAIGLFIPPTILPNLISHPLTILSTSFTLQPIEDRLFYLSAILIWISPVLALLTGLGAKVDLAEDWIAWAIGTGYLWIVDSIAIRAGAWAIDEKRTLGVFLWRGLPVE